MRKLLISGIILGLLATPTLAAETHTVGKQGVRPPDLIATPGKYWRMFFEIAADNNKRCGYGDATCMTKVCKSDLSSTALLGDWVCSRTGNSYFCSWACYDLQSVQ
jgi:hypothetical protein